MKILLKSSSKVEDFTKGSDRINEKIISAILSVAGLTVTGWFTYLVAKKNTTKDLTINDRQLLSEDERTFRNELKEMMFAYQNQVKELTSEVDRLTKSNRDLELRVHELTLNNKDLKEIVDDMKQANEELEERVKILSNLNHRLEEKLVEPKRKNTYLSKGGIKDERS